MFDDIMIYEKKKIKKIVLSDINSTIFIHSYIQLYDFYYFESGMVWQSSLLQSLSVERLIINRCC